jgi:hypothetical protein
LGDDVRTGELIEEPPEEREELEELEDLEAVVVAAGSLGALGAVGLDTVAGDPLDAVHLYPSQ